MKLNPQVFKRLAHTLQKDLLIVGGGPAGLSLATAIKSSSKTRNLDVAVVDAQPISQRLANWAITKQSAPFENRVISLTPKSIEFLQQIAAWDHVCVDRTFTYDEMRVWDGISGSSIEFDGSSSPTSSIATMIETSNVQQALYNTGSTADLVIHAGVNNITRNSISRPIVELSNGTKIEARLLVGADGQRSRVRAFAGIQTHGCDYGQAGVVATLDLEYDDFKSTAYQRFLSTGPLAILPMPDGHATLVWSTSLKRADWLKKSDANNVLPQMVNAGLRLSMADLDYLHSLDPTNGDKILDEISWRLDRVSDAEEEELPAMIESAHSVATFPLRLRNAETYAIDRVALVGDAAHATHPLTGQGLNMGQRDVQCLVNALELAVERGQDIGSLSALELYSKHAMPYDQGILNVNDSLVKLYSTDLWPVVALRSLGLSAVNNLDFVKDFLMSRVE